MPPPGCRTTRKRRSLDFPTAFALTLTVVTLVGLVALSTVTNYNTNNITINIDSNISNNTVVASSTRQRELWEEQQQPTDHGAVTDTDATNYTSHSCNYIYEVTPDAGADQCAFAKTCNQGTGVWAPSVFCSTRFARQTLVLALSPVMLLWMILLFRLLGSTAEDYFSPALEMLSVKLGLPPRFAGVTLLALGNGAADVSATVASITSDPVAGYTLSLGALTGAAMVISGVISAAVVLADVQGGVPCRGALVRDATALVLTVIAVWSQLASGIMGPEAISLFLTLYAMFVLLVLTADVYHRAVVLPRLAAHTNAVEVRRQLQHQQQVEEQQQQQQQNNNNSMGGLVPPGMPDDSNSSTDVPCHRMNPLSAVLTALSNYDINTTGTEGGTGWGIESEDLVHERPIQLHGHGGILDHHHHPPGPASVEQDPDNSYSVLDDSAAGPQTCVQTGTFGIPADSWLEALVDGRDELVQHAASVWNDIVHDDDIHPISKFLLLCELPFTVMRQITVPIPCEGYYCRALIALSMAVSPLWFFFYLWSRHDVSVLSGTGLVVSLVVELSMCTLALCLLRFAPNGTGELSLVFATPLALCGFFIAATWIDTIADSLVSLLNFIGIILRIPGPVIGLTILAWGNSMGDLSANMTMARKGLANMAMTACFAGPVFNILVGLGLGFSSLAAQTGKATTEVKLSPSVTCGFVFIILNAVALMVAGLGFGQGRIPKKFGYVALVVYAIYVVTSISLQYSKYGDDS